MSSRIHKKGESGLNSIPLNPKKKIKILRLTDSTTGEQDVTNISPRHENNDQKIRKMKRNKGERYYTKSGNVVRARKFENKDCKCKKLCKNRVKERDRRSLFNFFWNMGDFKKQNTFLCASAQRKPIKRRRGRNFKGTARDCSYKYFFNIEKESVTVCKKFFLETFDITVGRLHRALKAKVIGEDLRGKMKGSRRKTDEKLVEAVKNHIKNFIRRENCCRIFKNPHGKYLGSDLNVRKMHKLYVEKCRQDNAKFLSEQMYRKIFKDYCNVSYNRPVKDICEKGG